MISTELVDLSRLQFAVTALYHFLFVPLTLGMTFLLVIMEGSYLITGQQVYKDMTRFWGKLFGINFALGVTTGLTMEFQFGTNWAYYSHYVGDIFGAPLAIEGLMAFFLESTFIGLFFFGWDRLSKSQHFMVTVLTAIGSNLSALWILIANGWMQDPVGAEFSYTTMRMEMTNFWTVIFNPTAQAKFVHTVSAGYVTASMFVLGISSLVPAQGARHRIRAPFVPRRRRFRLRLRAVGDRARRRIGLHRFGVAADQAGRDGGDVAHRTGAGCVHTVRAAQREDATQRPRSEDPLRDGHHRHPQSQQGDSRHRRDQGEEPRAHRVRHDRGERDGSTAQGQETMPPPGSNSRRTRPTSASACC